MSRTRTQRHAGLALKELKRVALGPAKDCKSFKSRADSFGTMIMQSGLTQALGFVHAKAKEKVEGYDAYSRVIATVLGEKNFEKLHERAISSALPAYRQLTHEVLAAARTIKRYGQIELREKIDALKEPQP